MCVCVYMDLFVSVCLCVCVSLCDYFHFCQQAYLWHNNEAVVEWLEQELRETDPNNSVFLQNVELLKRDHAVQEVKR